MLRAGPGTIRDQGFQDTYANQLRMAVTPSDISIIFSVLTDRGPGTFTVDDRVSVRLAPITAKILMQHMQMIIASYEKVMGEISVPPRVAAQAEALAKNLTETLAQQMAAPSEEAAKATP
jgi:uncharacterized protein DUF3467